MTLRTAFVLLRLDGSISSLTKNGYDFTNEALWKSERDNSIGTRLVKFLELPTDTEVTTDRRTMHVIFKRNGVQTGRSVPEPFAPRSRWLATLDVCNYAEGEIYGPYELVQFVEMPDDAS